MKKSLFVILAVSILTTACNQNQTPVLETEDPVAPVVEKESTIPTDSTDFELGKLAIDKANSILLYIRDPQTDAEGNVTGTFYVGLLDVNLEVVQEINLSTFNPFAGDGGGIPIDATSENNLVWNEENNNFSLVKNSDGLFELTIDNTNSKEPRIFEIQFYEGQLNMVQ